jgi:hypothetical protein
LELLHQARPRLLPSRKARLVLLWSGERVR